MHAFSNTSASRSLGRRLALLVALLAMSVVATESFPGLAETAEELEAIRAQRRETQAKAAEQARRVDVANAEVGELTKALETLQAEVRVAEDGVNDAQRQLDGALAQLDEATQAVTAQRLEIEELRERLAERAISSFLHQGEQASLLIESADPNQAVRMHALVENVSQGEADVAEQLKTAEQDLEVQEALAADLKAEAEAHQAETVERLAVLDTARAEQAKLTAEAESRLDQKLSELDGLKELDADLAAKESAKANQLAEELARKPAPTAPTRTSSGSGGGGGGGTVGSGSIVSVRGIRVHQSIAGQVDSMLGAAAAAGVSLSGGGYRSSDGQIAVRKNNCGTSHYAIWEMPASSCRPPTARPGTSQHERGLAIDFTYNGSLIRSRSNAGYKWLASNAGAYGFKNLPSEPWHWSTTGR